MDQIVRNIDITIDVDFTKEELHRIVDAIHAILKENPERNCARVSGWHIDQTDDEWFGHVDTYTKIDTFPVEHK